MADQDCAARLRAALSAVSASLRSSTGHFETSLRRFSTMVSRWLGVAASQWWESFGSAEVKIRSCSWP